MEVIKTVTIKQYEKGGHWFVISDAGFAVFHRGFETADAAENRTFNDHPEVTTIYIEDKK